MKLIFYSPHPDLNLQSLSGYGTHMREMITAFEEQGCEVLPVIMGGITKNSSQKKGNSTSGTKKFLKKSLGNRIWETMKDLNLMVRDRSFEKQILKAAKEFKSDFIYERANYMQVSGVETARKLSIPHVLEVNSPQMEERQFLSSSKSFLQGMTEIRERQLMSKSSLVVPINNALKDYLKTAYHIDESKFLVLPNAFNKDTISLNPDYQSAIRRKYQLTGKTVIGFVGSIFEWHNLENLIEAFSMIPVQNTKLMIVGFGEFVDQLKEKALKSSRSEDIIFTGKVSKNEVFDFISVMDICTAPGAAWYQCPIKIFEYGAIGKPVLAPNTPPVKEIIDNGIHGYLSGSQPAEIFETLNLMINDYPEAKNMGKRLQKRIFEEFTWDDNASQILKRVDQL